MVTTLILPGLPGVTGKVDPIATAFINDVVYATFYSTETGIPGSEMLEGGTLMSTTLSPDDIAAVFTRNINTFLNSPPYKGSKITGASVELLSNVRTSKGISLSWFIKVSSGSTLIRADLNGSVLYKITAI